MMKTFLVATTVAILGTTGASAQGFSGGSIGIEYSELDELAEYEKTTFDAALEYELTPGFAIAGNLSYYSYVDADDVVAIASTRRSTTSRSTTTGWRRPMLRGRYRSRVMSGPETRMAPILPILASTVIMALETAFR